MNRFILSIIGMLVINQIVYADTKIVVETSDMSITTWANDYYFRSRPKQKKGFENANFQEGDILGDLKANKVYMISDKDKVIIDMSTPTPFSEMSKLSKMYRPEKIKITYKNKGTGEKIAGLKTIKYDIMVANQKCFEVLLSKDAAYSSLIKKYNSLDNNEGDSQGDICEQAENQMDDEQYAKYGYVVKSTKANGEIDMLLKEFKINVKAPKKYLSLPSGYKLMTMMEAMSKAMMNGVGQ